MPAFGGHADLQSPHSVEQRWLEEQSLEEKHFLASSSGTGQAIFVHADPF
jgi:hypothetical protein